jgi:hypothetical protein
MYGIGRFRWRSAEDRGGRPVRFQPYRELPYPPRIKSYPRASIETTLRSGLMPNLGAAARIASAMKLGAKWP